MQQPKHKFLLIFPFLLATASAFGQINPANAFPELFQEVQESQLFSDQKHFTDCPALFSPDTIRQRYARQQKRKEFSLRHFVGTHFDTSLVDTADVAAHINNLWSYLERKPRPKPASSSLIQLPHPYIVPGGRFREIYYWDSYFTMLGLQEAGRHDMVRHMVENFAWLIDTYDHIPNGNRTYYLSRSQPPFFSYMVDLLAEIEGKEVYEEFLPQLEKEYGFWMKGQSHLKGSQAASRRVVQMQPGVILNRYWDSLQTPRPESYVHDIRLKETSGRDSSIYRDIRAAAESGWDFSSRWFVAGNNMKALRTTDILPIDLNSLLYHMELTLQKAWKTAGDRLKPNHYKRLAKRRRELIRSAFWNKYKGFFFDFNYSKQIKREAYTLAGVYPLFTGAATQQMANEVAEVIKKRFLKAGGLVTSLDSTGQQWDAPNGWAPLQWIAYKGLKRYGHHGLAATIAQRWMDTNIDVFFRTGKMMEKYDVQNPGRPGGGGEYQLQDGFGWTNGVYLKFLHIHKKP